MAGVAAAALAAVAIAGCGDDLTEILVVVDSDLSVPGEIDRVEVQVTGSTTATSVGDLTGARAQGFPRTLGLVHSGGPLGPITVRATGKSAGAVVVERRATTHFRTGKVLVLHLLLERACVGVSCPDGQTCAGGACRSDFVDPGSLPEWDGHLAGPDAGTCRPVPERCNGLDDDCDGLVDEDFDLRSDLLHCGACNSPCSGPNAMVACVAGTCALTGCNEGFEDCNGMADDGCEASLSSPEACGACDVTCAFPNAEPLCVDLACAQGDCLDGFADCNADTVADDGCETPLDTVTDCGACGVPCEIPGAVGTCETGTCEIAACEEGLGDCNAATVPDDGCEQPLDTLVHCGACDVPCEVANGTPTCVTTTCEVGSCDAGFGDCDFDATNGCERTLAASGSTPCTVANGTGECATGTCEVATCAGGFADCNGDPRDGCEAHLASDVMNCLTCGNVCAPGERCRPAGCR